MSQSYSFCPNVTFDNNMNCQHLHLLMHHCHRKHRKQEIFKSFHDGNYVLLVYHQFPLDMMN